MLGLPFSMQACAHCPGLMGDRLVISGDRLVIDW